MTSKSHYFSNAYLRYKQVENQYNLDYRPRIKTPYFRNWDFSVSGHLFQTAKKTVTPEVSHKRILWYNCLFWNCLFCYIACSIIWFIYCRFVSAWICTYRSSVVRTEVCPSISDRDLVSKPCSTQRQENWCRRAWILMGGIPHVFSSAAYLRWMTRGSMHLAVPDKIYAEPSLRKRFA